MAIAYRTRNLEAGTERKLKALNLIGRALVVKRLGDTERQGTEGREPFRRKAGGIS
jgi:hypothetical protein